MVLAFSLSSEIKTIGSYAGFAALVAVALLVLLYFAQARETRRLSEWIERDEERRRAMPAPRPAAAPAPPSPGVVTTAVPGVRRVAVPAAAPTAPATAAGALTAVVAPQAPAAEPEAKPALEPQETPVADVPESADAAPVAADQTAVSPPRAAVPLAAPPAPTAEPPEQRFAPPVEAGTKTVWDAQIAAEHAPRNGEEGEDPAAEELPADGPIVAERTQRNGEERMSVAALVEDPVEETPSPAPPLGPSTPAGSRPRFPPPPGRPEPFDAGADVTVRVAGSAGAAAFSGAPPASGPRRREREFENAPRRREAGNGGPRRSIGPTLRLLAAAAVIVAVLIVIATQVFGGSSTPPASNGQTTTPPASRSSNGPAPSSVTVAVLNGTHTSHLATGAASILGGLGFRQGAIANAPSQGHTFTIVGYTAGNLAAADEVARDLQLSQSHVQPAVASSVSAARAAGLAPQVVVTLGTDYATG